MVAVPLILLLVSPCILGSDLPFDRATLVGIKSIRVIIEDLTPESPEGLTKSQLQTDVELKLRLAGAKVPDSPSPHPYLYVRVNSMTSGVNYVYAITVSLEQPVTVLATNTLYPASTWSVDTIAIAGRSVALEKIRSNVADSVDKFLNAYLSVNPK
jgi:hypothetical protein